MKPASLFRPILIVTLIVGLATAAYTSWAIHRLSFNVLTRDPEWPRVPPYPDTWLLALNDWYDARYPTPYGFMKLHGEISRVRWTLYCILFGSGVVAAIGGVSLSGPFIWRWAKRRHPPVGFELLPRASVHPQDGDDRTRSD